jgi:predicted amidohydrolase YtcJ
VTRERANGEPRGGWHPQEKLTVAETVKAYITAPLTLNGVGDALVLSHDIFAVPPREILNTQVETTVVGGQVVHAL